MTDNQNKGEIIIYKAPEGPELRVDFHNETVWLTQEQIAQLFGTQRPAITKHLNNIFKDGELKASSVCSILEHTASDNKTYKVKYYSLDAIISVGYRVNSKKATQFRVWATQKLGEFLLKGYLVNERRLKENQQVKLKELQQAHQLIMEALETRRLTGYEGELLRIISDYTNTWVVLNEYDQGDLSLESVSKKKAELLDYAKIKLSIERFKLRLEKEKEGSELFGQEVGSKLNSVLGAIGQTYSGKELYPSIEEKAAHLLYFAVKDHPFVDGNKRIGALMFILFLINNNHLVNKKGQRKVNDAALTALTLLVAESKPQQKDVMIKLIVNLINNK
jgi:prophage maintenance system killer protein/phage regulator Rha-like protein